MKRPVRVIYEMEPDSTTILESNQTSLITEKAFPFRVSPENFQTYKNFTTDFGTKSFDRQIIKKLQSLKLLPQTWKCFSLKPECTMVLKTARVIDKIQWVCEACGRRQPIRSGSFFLRIPCSLLQILQIILAWCEDADMEVAAQYFGVKPKVANFIYDKLDDLSVREQSKHRLGGEDIVVLTEIYPDCLNRLSPDTTDQPHAHRILMMADTNHVPTSYKFHVILEDAKKSLNMDSQSLKSELESVISNAVKPNSLLVVGNNMPAIEGAATLQHLAQNCDTEMIHFLTSSIWRQAVNLCAASRDLCSTERISCGAAAQRYLHAAAYRRRLPTDFYLHVLRAVAEEYTEKN